MKYKSITVTARGGLDAVRIVERDLRAPAPGEARMRVLASAVCQDDVAIRVGNRPFLRKPPYVPGYSFIGVVDALGDGVTEVAVGDRVTALTTFDSHAEVVYRRAADLAPVPDDIDPVTASTLILNYLVAQQILHRVAHVRPGDTALIIGASGGVGTALLQLGEVAGLRMYGTASPAKHPTLAAHGATPIDYRTQDVAEVISSAEPEGLDFVFNGMGPEYVGPGMGLLRRGGMLVAYGAPQGFGDFLKLIGAMLRQMVRRDGRRIRGYGTHRQGVESFKQDWATLFELLRDGRIAPVVQRIFPLLEATDAYALLESGRVTGNLVLVAPELLDQQPGEPGL